MAFPDKIICLTEESVETLYLLGKAHLIQGVSQYVERPPEAKSLPRVSQFIRSDVDKIVSMKPDLVIGFSDIQKDIAQELIGRGLNVFVTNQRSLREVLNQILLLGQMVDAKEKAQNLIDGFRQKMASLPKLGWKPRVYFEEWDHPRISAIQWVSELIELVGGENIFAHKTGGLARERTVTDEEVIAADPDLIFGCWCGKKVKLDSIMKRPGYEKLKAVQNKQVFELPPEVFLQPGPALFVDGIDQMRAYLSGVPKP